MKEIVEYLVKSLVNNPDSVAVTEENSDFGKVVRINVDISDKGRVIGKQGRIINALRQIVSASAAKNGGKCRVEVSE
jgi:hypothetical protein